MAGEIITKVSDGNGMHLISNSFYGTCSTAAATAAKEVIINNPNIDSVTLVRGMVLTVKFTYANGVASPTLTLFNNSGTEASPSKGATTLVAAKNIYRYGTTAPSTSAASSWQANAIVPFIYDGSAWIEASSWDNNTTYTALSLGFGYGTCSTAAGTKAKVGTLSSGVLGANGSIVVMKFPNGNTIANPTLNVNSKGAKDIYWKGAALTDIGLIEAGATVTFMYDGTQYQIIGIYYDKPATTDLFRAYVVASTSTSVPEGSLYSMTADLPVFEGYEPIGILQMWSEGTGNTIIGSGSLSNDHTTAKCKVRANVASTIVAYFLILYIKSEFAPSITYA